MKILSLLSIFYLVTFAWVVRAETPGETQRQMKRLSEDRRAMEAVETLFTAAKEAAVATQKVKGKPRWHLKRSLAKYAKQIKESKGRIPPIPRTLQAYLPIRKGDFKKLSGLVKQLKVAYPLVDNQAEIGGALSLMFFRMDYDFTDIDPDYCGSVDCECQRECDEEYRLAYNEAGYTWFRNAIEDFGVDTLIFGFVGLVEEIVELQERLADCRARCNGLPSDWECQNHEDCDDDEYCAKPFGNPVNICTTKRPEGWACSSDAKCMSGCCKYHFPTNPLQMVCRPADRCD